MLGLLFLMENYVTVVVRVEYISAKWQKSTQSVVFNLTEGS